VKPAAFFVCNTGLADFSFIPGCIQWSRAPESAPTTSADDGTRRGIPRPEKNRPPYRVDREALGLIIEVIVILMHIPSFEPASSSQ